METRNVLITEDYEDEPAQSQLIENCKLSDINNPKSLKNFLMTHVINNYLDACYDRRKYRTPDLTIDTDKLLPTNKDVENFVKAFNNKKTVWLQIESSGTDQSLYSFKFK